jgi:hypothetical protein
MCGSLNRRRDVKCGEENIVCEIVRYASSHLTDSFACFFCMYVFNNKLASSTVRRTCDSHADDIL